MRATYGRAPGTAIEQNLRLLQVSSAFGRAMESMDRQKMCTAVFPALLDAKAAGAKARSLANAIAACSEGYSFPTDLDRDQPVDGLAPTTQARLLTPRPRGTLGPRRAAP